MDAGAVVQEVLKSQVHMVIGLVILWAAIGLILSILLAILSYKVLGRLGAWKLDWKHGGLLRLLSALWLVFAFAFCGVWIGGAEGVMRGVERVLRRSQFHDKILMPVGNAAADGLLIVDLSLQNMDPETNELNVSAEEQKKLVEAFREGQARLNVKQFQERIAAFGQQVVEDAAEGLKEKLREETGLEADGLAETLLDWLLQGLVRRSATSEAQQHLGPILKCYRTLPTAADEKGMISRTALADHLIDRGVIPAIMKPTRYVVRATQIPWAVGMALSLVPPPLLFFILRRCLGGSKTAESQQPPAKSVD